MESFVIPEEARTPVEPPQTSGFSIPIESQLRGRLQNETPEKLAEDRAFPAAHEVLNALGASTASPDDVEKLAALKEAQDKRPFSGAEFAKGAVTGAGAALSGMVKGAGELARTGFATSPVGVAYGLLSGQGTAPAKEALAEQVAGLETAALGDSALVRSGYHKLTQDRKNWTRQDWKTALFDDAAQADQQAQAAKGEGTVTSAAGLNADNLAKQGLSVDPAAIENLSQVEDPAMLLPIGAGAEVAGRLVPQAVKGAGEAALKGAGTLVKATGGGIEKGAGLLKKAVTGTSGTVIGHFLGHPIAGGAVGVVGPALLQGGGKALQAVGKRLTGEVAPGPLLQFAGRGLKSGAAGALATAPLALAADNDEQAGQILGGGAAFGAVAGEAAHIKSRAVEAGQKAGQAVMSKIYEGADRTAPVADFSGSGELPEADALHQRALDDLKQNDPPAANLINRLRAVLSSFGTELYLVPAPEYDANPANKSSVGNFQTTADGKTRVFVRSDGSDPIAAAHESSHAIMAAMTPEYRSEFYKDIQDSFTPQQIADFKGQYEANINRGRPAETQVALDTNTVLNEMGAELLSGVLQAAPLDRLPTGLKDKALRIVGGVLESTGLYRPESVSKEKAPYVTEGGVKMSENAVKSAREFFENRVQSPETQAALAKIERPPLVGGGDGKIIPFPSEEKPFAIPSEHRDTPAASEPPVIAPPVEATPPPAPAAPQPGLATPTPAELFDKTPNPRIPQGNPPPGLATEPPPAELFGGFGRRPFSPEKPAPATSPERLPGTAAPQPETPLNAVRRKLAAGDFNFSPEEVKAWEEWRTLQGAVAPEAPAAATAPEPDALKPATVAPEPAKPANLRVTPEQQRAFDKVPERTDIGIQEAEAALKDAPPEQKENFEKLREVLRAPQGEVVPVEIVHGSVTPEDEGALATQRTQRRSEQENQAGARVDAQKLLIPASFVQTKEGKTQLTAYSPDKMLANAERIGADAEKKGVANLLPYEVKDGAFSADAQARFRRDLVTYLSNQANGYTGAGKSLVRPKNYEGFLPSENPAYTPKPLSEHVAQFLNLIQGIAPPKTNRVQRDAAGVPIQKPLNVRGRELAEVNLKTVTKPGITGDPAKQKYADFGDVEIGETNPLRKALDEKGVNTRERLESTERINLENIKSVTPRPESTLRAPAADMIAAGFMPTREITADEVNKFTPDEFFNAAHAWKGGLTGQAIELGKRIHPDELPVLQSYRDAALQRMGEAKAKGDLDGMMAEVSRAQFFREASEASRASRGETGLSITPERLAARAFMPDPRRASRAANEDVRDVASDYMKSIGRKYVPESTYQPVNVEFAKKIADYYDQAKSTPNDPAVKASYQALAKETMAQYDAMKKAGVEIEPWTGKGEPYHNSAEMIADVNANKHLYFLRTENAFGDTQSNDKSNPMLAPSGVEIDGTPLLVNDIFRAVHDYFGHVKEGNQFGPRGEFNAWRDHSQMFSDKAQGALAAETLAQNSWVNYGPQMRDANGDIRSNVPLSERSFAEQKNIVIPQELIDEAKGSPEAALRFMPSEDDTFTGRFDHTEETDPKTDTGRELEAKGFQFRALGAAGEFRNIEIRKKGKVAGFITAIHPKTPDKARVFMVEVDPKFQGKGLGETLYRELGAQLQQDGAKELAGDVIHPATLAIRKKVFGDFSDLRVNKKPASFDEAVQAAEQIAEKKGYARVSPTNQIDPDMQFMPELPTQFERDEPLPNSVGEPVKVVHYSSRELQTVDPQKFGKAFATKNDLRGDNKSFFFVAGSPLGRDRQFFGEGSKDAYGAVLDGNSLYDLTAGKPDPLKWGSTINRLEADENVQNAGYAGIMVDTGKDDGRKVVMTFKPVDVSPLGRPGPSEQALRFMPGFFSQLEKTVDSKVPDNATPEQVLGTLRNPQNGIKGDEIKWSGIEDFLAGKKKVTRQELRDFLAANRIDVKEKVLKSADPEAAAAIDAEWDRIHEEIRKLEKERDALDQNDETENDEYYRLDDRIAALDKQKDDLGWKLNDAKGDETKFAKYTLPGGKNYREILFTLPPKTDAVGKLTYAQLKQELLDDYAALPDAERKKVDNISFKVANKHFPFALEQNLISSGDFQPADAPFVERWQKWGKIAEGERQNSYQSSHWDEKNVLAHSRVADHQTPDGKSVLLAEEIQSDWHQEGRKKGYRKGYRRDELSLNGAASDERFWIIDAPGQTFQILKREHPTSESALNYVATQKDRVSGVPDAPFKNTWHEFVFKTLLRDAVAEGKDYLAWTPGELQADRYDLSKQVKRVYWYPDESGSTGVLIASALEGGEIINQRMPAEKVEDYIGKEAAKRLLESPDAKDASNNTIKRLEGDGLKVGGEGMAGFYDKILPTFANKYAKKWGSTVEKVAIKNSGAYQAQSDPDGGFLVADLDNRGRTVEDGFRTLGEAERWLRTHLKLTEVWALPITDAMRQSLPETGQPLFMPQTAVRKPGQFGEIARKSKPDFSGVQIRARNAQRQDSLTE